jgi:nucleotide-binding universal stress UspA family protein
MNTMVHEGRSRMSLGLHPRRILAVVDLKRGSQEVLDCALQYAEMHGASVHFLHVIEKASFLFGMKEVVLALSEEERVEEARIELLAFMDQRDRRGLEASPLVRLGSPEKVIKQAAEDLEADLIILHGNCQRGMKGAIPHSAPCTVLVLKE